jgi:regulator of extracellular matrix RemA (YlzA/DUF370 family)
MPGADLLHVGFGHFIALNRVVSMVSPNSAPIQRRIREGKKKGMIVDITSGRRTKCAIFTDDGSIYLIAITPEAIAGRAAAARSPSGRGERAQTGAPAGD